MFSGEYFLSKEEKDNIKKKAKLKKREQKAKEKQQEREKLYEAPEEEKPKSTKEVKKEC